MTAATAPPVGTAGLFHISHTHGQAAFGLAIGERRGQGLGTEATRLVLDFAFHVLQLRNVLLETLGWNVAGLTAYERAGFRRVGVRRGAVMSRGRPTDLVIMDAVPEDFGASSPQLTEQRSVSRAVPQCCRDERRQPHRAAQAGRTVSCVAASRAGTGGCKSARLPMQSRRDRSGTTATSGA